MDAALLEDALSGSTFTAEAYKLDIPTLDNRSARNLFLRFSGTGNSTPRTPTTRRSCEALGSANRSA